MVLSIIGLGLSDEKDITVRGLQCVKDADYVYLEAYTAVLLVQKNTLEEFYGKKIIESDRTAVEEKAEEMLAKAVNNRVAFLVVGDPFCATTHGDIYLRARRMGISVEVVHNASIMSAVAACGLQLYRFGETVSIPYFDGGWRPQSFYDKIKKNKNGDLHTLCLLDIKVKERTTENLLRDLPIYEKPRFMSVKEAIEQLFEIEENRQEGVTPNDAMAFGLARVGSDSQTIVAGTLEELKSVDFGAPLHSLVICASTLHEIENEFFNLYKKEAQGK